MDYTFTETIVIGAIGSLVGGIISYLFRNILENLFSFLSTLLHRPKKINGSWNVVLGESGKYHEKAEIKQWGRKIYGDIECLKSLDDEDVGKKFEFRGEIRENDVIGFYWLKSDRNSDNGTFFLKHSDNNSMVGESTVFNQSKIDKPTNGIESLSYKWTYISDKSR